MSQQLLVGMRSWPDMLLFSLELATNQHHNNIHNNGFMNSFNINMRKCHTFKILIYTTFIVYILKPYKPITAFNYMR